MSKSQDFFLISKYKNILQNLYFIAQYIDVNCNFVDIVRVVTFLTYIRWVENSYNLYLIIHQYIQQPQ